MNAMKVNPFTVRGAHAWPLQRSGDDTEQLQEQEVQQLARLLGRLLDVAESDPDLYEALPWLKNVSLWELLLKRKAEARLPYVPRFQHSSHSSDLSRVADMPEVPKVPSVPITATTLLSFFARTTEPVVGMVEALYTSSLLRDTRTVWEILYRMAQSAGVEPLSSDVVVALCASLTRSRLITLSECRPRPHRAVWTITCRRILVHLQWPKLARPAEPPVSLHAWSRSTSRDTSTTSTNRNTLLVLVREVITHKAGIGYQQTGKVLAFRCLPDPLDRQGLGYIGNAGDGNAGETTECIESLEAAMKLALYDALVFSRSRDGQFNWPIRPPTLLRVQAPVPRAIREAASVWGIQVEEVGEDGRDGRDGKEPEREATDQAGEELEKWDKELGGRVLDPAHYMRILDRGLERTYGYAPFLAKQRVTRHQGWLWSMHPEHDPMLNYVGLRELLPSHPVVVGDDGSIEWQGWHYRDYEEDVLRYFSHVQVTVKRSPLTDAVILVYSKGAILCYAIADEFTTRGRHVPRVLVPLPSFG